MSETPYIEGHLTRQAWLEPRPDFHHGGEDVVQILSQSAVLVRVTDDKTLAGLHG